MKILLYNPDNGVTRNFMPHLWMFLLQALTPPGHEVILIDGNARAMDEEELVAFARRRGVGLVGIGAMTRMVARAYRFADAPIQYRISVFVARLFFRGIYFPQMTRRAWLKLTYDNRRVIYRLVKEAAGKWRKSRQSADVSVEARAS